MKEDPATLELRAKPRPVMRLNRRTLVVLVGAIALLVLLSALWAFRDRKETSVGATQEARNVERLARAEGLEALPKDYRDLLPLLPAAAGDRAEPDASPDSSDSRADTQPLQEEADQAAKAPLFFQASRRSVDEVPKPNDSGAAQPVAAPPTPVTTPGSDDGRATQNQQALKREFVAAKTQNQIYAGEDLQPPRSPYQLLAGTVIPAALLTGINSDLPGQVIATVTEHVYDSVTGRQLLVPQGSRLLGQYDSQVAYGQRRVLLVWTRLIRPDGASILLDRMPGMDVAGQAGLEDRVDGHWGRFFTGAALSTLIGVTAELAVSIIDSEEDLVLEAASESVQDTANAAGQQITRRNLNLQPTLTVRPGFPVRVIVNGDLILEPTNLSR